MSVRVGDELVAGGQGDMYTKAQVDALIASAIAQTTEKPGMIKPFAGTTVPTGYLLCDGSAVSRTTYANLFAAIGTTYGTGDGSTTFNLPGSMYKRTLAGFGGDFALGTISAGEIPDIKGRIDWVLINENVTTSGVFSTGKNVTAGVQGSNTSANPRYIDFKASSGNSLYGSYGGVLPRSLAVKFVIKY